MERKFGKVDRTWSLWIIKSIAKDESKTFLLTRELIPSLIEKEYLII